MDIARTASTSTIINAHEALSLSHKEHYECPSCGVELVLISGNPRRKPFFRQAPNLNHSESCEYHIASPQKPKEIEFESLLFELMSHHPSFSEVKRDQLLGRDIKYRADIIAKTVGPSGETAPIHIECKTFPPSNYSEATQILSQLLSYRNINPSQNIILATPATITDNIAKLFRENKIEVWDMEYLSDTFSHQISQTTPNYFGNIIALHIKRCKTTREEDLIRSLKKCIPGKAEWHVYQKLVGEIFAHLFSPPLNKLLPETSDYPKANRRDFIVPNYADSGFWYFLRQRYLADYIVIDAKNYARQVQKKDILQVANYLKPYGAGLFALIISRNGGDSSGCLVSLREQWLVHQKMIIILNDEDIETMLLAASESRDPADIIGAKIEQFRLLM
ncbi:MAG: HNH endonuclease [Microcystis aeruginosa Ma_MB_F_20061100_S20D]|uniref:HNH endonuclease n=1 Tax=Microcystis aeruginosa Ma_MB_F_20061100_S20D TaxID=2486253 RepID=A0A552EBZ8_MICAE|nr:MAG: HNH endonuclease [Microcystis aeruginosa Ma_MB_F_20061100_S20D]